MNQTKDIKDKQSKDKQRRTFNIAAMICLITAIVMWAMVLWLETPAFMLIFEVAILSSILTVNFFFLIWEEKRKKESNFSATASFFKLSGFLFLFGTIAFIILFFASKKVTYIVLLFVTIEPVLFLLFFVACFLKLYESYKKRQTLLLDSEELRGSEEDERE